MKLTIKELSLLKEHAINGFIAIPHTCRLPGMDRDLTENEKRSYAFLEASIMCLNGLGLINQLALEAFEARLVTMTYHHDIIDAAMETVTFKTK